MIKKIKNKIRNIKYVKERKRLLIVGCMFLIILLVSGGLLGTAFATYQSSLKLHANIDRAFYLFGGDRLSFNIDPAKIVPSSTPYTYKFSVSNFNASRQSDINIEYTVDVRSTTNLPITLELYRNSETNDLLSNVDYLNDSDGAWYRVYETSDVYTMNYRDKVTDIYTLKILFPSEYAQDTTYADAIENIEIFLKSKQIN